MNDTELEVHIQNVQDIARLESLLSDCSRGSIKSFETLYADVSPKLFSLLLRILKKKDHAEEVLQEGFVEIWKNSNRYESAKGKPFTWMASIMRYRALDRLRQNKHDKNKADDRWLENLRDEKQNPFEHLVTAKEAAALHGCLEQLSSDQQKCVSLAYYDGLTHEEIAKVKSTPLGTVKTWLRRGLEQLKNCLEK